MTNKEIIENNILIAKFMGWRIDNSFPDKGKVWRLGNRIELESTFKFHCDWNCLIEAIIKFNKNLSIKTNIELVYQEFVELLKKSIK